MDQLQYLLYFLRIRIFMNTVHKRYLPLTILRCHRLIGRKHEILYHIRSHISLIGTDLYGMARLTQNDLTLREIKIYGSSVFPGLPDFCRQLCH